MSVAMESESGAVSSYRPPSFVEVYVADGARRRFAAGTKAGFAIDRINRGEAEMSTRYSYITAVKEGEDSVEFGPDAELVSYGEGWKLDAVQDVELVKSIPIDSKVEAKTETKAVTQPVRKWYDIAPPDLPHYRPQKDEPRHHPPQTNSYPHAVGSSKVGRSDLPELSRKDTMILQRQNLVNWPQNPSPKWCWPTETDIGVSNKQRREKNFVWASPERRHTILTRIYCPSLSPTRQSVYNVDKP